MKFLTEEHKEFLRGHFRKRSLSRSEIEVVILVLQGLINREVANKLCVAEKTIKFHLGNAYKKLKISRRSQLIWTLPLAEFVNVTEKSNNPNPNSVNQNSQQFNNDAIPSGCRTIGDEALDNNLQRNKMNNNGHNENNLQRNEMNNNGHNENNENNEMNNNGPDLISL